LGSAGKLRYAGEMTAEAIARLKITLDDIKPQIFRRIEAPLTLRLDRLHLVFQVAMGWTNAHLHEISAGDVRWSEPDADGENGSLDSRKGRLIDVVNKVGSRTFSYLYDFGDGWEHTIKIERIFDAEADAQFPRLIEAVGNCPPEDCGGPYGYAGFLEAIADPNHESHAELVEWIGYDFDASDAGFEERASDVESLARKWAREPASKKSRSK
jgi:hypothetical protein